MVKFIFVKSKRAIFISLFLVTYLFPLIVTSSLYGKIVREVWFRGIRSNLFTESQQWKEAISKKRVIRMLVIIVVVISLCWRPVWFMHIFYAVTIFREPLPRARCCQQSGQLGGTRKQCH